MARARQRAYLDRGIRLDINELIRGGIRSGNHRLDATIGGSASKGLLTVRMEEPARFLRFQFQDFDQTIGLTIVPRPFGGVQWYFFCPMMGDRASVLWMPRGQNAFASQRYWQMRGRAYRSQFLTPVDRAERGIERLEAKLIYNETDEMMYKPKRMRLKTYDRICARLDAYEALRDERLIQMVARLTARL